MTFTALGAWLLTAALGLYMLVIWLMEDDGSPDGPGYRLLLAPVVFTHAGLAIVGLFIWIVYLPLNSRTLGWAAVALLVLVAVLGLTMFVRWLRYYRLAAAPPARSRFRPETGAHSRPAAAVFPRERNLPLSAVLLHFAAAVATLVLVLITTLLRSGF